MSGGFADRRHLSGLVNLTARLLQDRIARDLAPFGLTYAQAITLVRLWRAPEGMLRQVDLVRSLTVSRPAATELVNGLEEMGLLSRSPDPDDGRRHLVVLTESGRRLEPDVVSVFDRVEGELIGDLPAGDVDGAFRVLRSILDEVRAAHQDVPVRGG